ncbi:MAG: cell division protein ZipA, partial [Pseudomonadota bacterium]|nr:cell division protein ZipA [Pseudomonadota bacterium]
RNLGGDLKDERRSVMTPQTIEHCRQRIREFERKQRSKKA